MKEWRTEGRSEERALSLISPIAAGRFIRPPGGGFGELVRPRHPIPDSGTPPRFRGTGRRKPLPRACGAPSSEPSIAQDGGGH